MKKSPKTAVKRLLSERLYGILFLFEGIFLYTADKVAVYKLFFALSVLYCHRPKWQNGIKVIAKQLYFGINKSVMIFVNIGHNHFLLL